MSKLNSILKGFNKTIEKLDKLYRDHRNSIETNKEVIENLTERNEELDAEAAQAMRVASRLRHMVEGN